MPRRRLTWILGFAAAALVIGCHKPFLTKNDIDMRMSAVMDSRLLTPISFALPNLNGPVVPVPVGGVPCSLEHGQIAVLDVDGPLVNAAQPGLGPFEPNSLALFQQKLDAVAATPGVKAVVLRLNSPGGGVTVTELMCSQLQRFKARTNLPLVACLLEVGTGGAYYLATVADVIVAHPTTIAGGIGCVINLYNLRETMAALNILDQSIKSGDNIDMATTVRALPQDASKLLKEMAGEFHDRFKSVVRQARPGLKGPEAEVFDGRIMSGKQALDRGLVDRLGDLDDALAAARQLGPGDKAGVVMFRHEQDRAWSPYAVTASLPFSTDLVPARVPGLDRKQPPPNQMPLFLYMWLPDPN